MALVVDIKINDDIVITRWCRRLEALNGSEVYDYETDDGRIIKHRYDDGAEKLAIKLLRGDYETTDELRLKRRKWKAGRGQRD